MTPPLTSVHALRLSRRDLLRLKPPAVPDTGDHWLRVHRAAMACRFEITLSSERAADVPAALDALAEAGRLEAALTVFRPSSDVMQVNRTAGDAPAPVGDELFALLTTCRRLHDETGGAFDVTTTPLSRAWGFLDRRPARPSDEALAAALAAVGMTRVALDAEARTVRFLAAGMALNFGSIGKGFAVARIADALRARGATDALVSAGGSSVAAVGRRRWSVDVVSRASARCVARLALRGAALATSGAGEQFVGVDGTRRGHVLDPRTGWPAAGILSASAVADDAAEADALATAFFVGGLELARAYCDTHPRTMALIVPEGAETAVVIGTHPSVIVEEL